MHNYVALAIIPATMCVNEMINNLYNYYKILKVQNFQGWEIFMGWLKFMNGLLSLFYYKLLLKGIVFCFIMHVLMR